MVEQPERVSFCGALGRAVVTPERAELRFYDFDFSTDLDAKPVFVVHFDKPAFGKAGLEGLMDLEVEISASDDRIEASEIYGEAVYVLRAKSVSSDRESYDAEDYVRRIRTLGETCERLNNNLRAAQLKNHRGHSLTIELLRRAEIKAAASEFLRQRQTATISALGRLLRHFEGDK